jgi:hypothetical protein
MVGACTGLMPPLYLFSIGDVFTTGVEGSYRRSPGMIVSYFLAGLVYVAFLFPIGLLALAVFWVRLWRHIPARRLPAEEEPAPAER